MAATPSWSCLCSCVRSSDGIYRRYIIQKTKSVYQKILIEKSGTNKPPFIGYTKKGGFNMAINANNKIIGTALTRTQDYKLVAVKEIKDLFSKV